jgi:hypothetical protein
MTIFAILMPTPQPALVAEITRLYPDDHLSLNETQYLISASGTVQGLTTKLGMGPTREAGKELTGNAVIFATSSYWGRAPAAVWDWMKVKLEAPPSGE